MSVALTNPKGILFFSALFPQFLTQDAPLLEQFVVLTTAFSVCALLSHSCYALLAHNLRNQFASPAGRGCSTVFPAGYDTCISGVSGRPSVPVACCDERIDR